MAFLLSFPLLLEGTQERNPRGNSFFSLPVRFAAKRLHMEGEAFPFLFPLHHPSGSTATTYFIIIDSPSQTYGLAYFTHTEVPSNSPLVFVRQVGGTRP